MTKPVLARVASPSSRDSVGRTTRFAQQSLEQVGAIFAELERGQYLNFADMCDRMLSNDPQIAADLGTRVSAVVGSRRYVETGALPDDDEQARADAETIARAYDHALSLCANIDEAIQSVAADGVGKGLGCAEIVWGWDGAMFLPTSIEWVNTRRFAVDKLQRVCLADDGKTYSQPGQPLAEGKWIVHSPATLSGYHDMRGCLRACVYPYVFKRMAIQFHVSGAESFAWPFIYAVVSQNATEQARDEVQRMLDVLSTDHRAVVPEGSDFRMLETSSKDGGIYSALIESQNAEISKAILGLADLANGQKIGAYGAVESRKGSTVNARIALDERALANTFRRDLGRYFAEYNAHLTGGRIARAPWLRWSVMSQQKEIPAYVIPYLTADEIRATVDLPPVAKAAPSESVMNGAQVQSLVLILQGVGKGEIKESSAVEAILASFQGIERAQAERMVYGKPTEVLSQPNQSSPTAPEAGLATENKGENGVPS